MKEGAQAGEFTIENRHSHMVKAIGKYNEMHAEERKRVVKQFAKYAIEPKPPIAVFGAGSHTDFRLRYTVLGKAAIRCLIETNMKKCRTKAFG